MRGDVGEREAMESLRSNQDGEKPERRGEMRNMKKGKDGSTTRSCWGWRLSGMGLEYLIRWTSINYQETSASSLLGLTPGDATCSSMLLSSCSIFFMLRNRWVNNGRVEETATSASPSPNFPRSSRRPRTLQPRCCEQSETRNRRRPPACCQRVPSPPCRASLGGRGPALKSVSCLVS